MAFFGQYTNFAPSEPCIRGHRSTKCNHANERLMVPVRKPGRPLSLCPHPPSRQCGCAGVTAAIPRKQTCGCGTSKSKASKNGVSSQATSPTPNDTAPGSPTKPGSSSASFRVQKSSKPPSRKASIDPSSIERMDASQINLLPAFDTTQQAQTPSGTVHMPTPPGNGYSPMPISPHHTETIDAMIMPFYSQPVASPALDHSLQHNPASSYAMNGTSQSPNTTGNPQVAPRPSPSHTSGGCCSGSNSRIAAPEPKQGSCCSSKSSRPGTESIPNGIHGATPPIQHPSPAMMTPNMAPNHAPYPPYFSHPTIFHYPPNYGSYLQPLLPDLWKQAMTSMMAQALSSSGVMGTPDLGFMPTGTPNTPSLGSSHVCTCGDGCQCIGCAAHPYNDATQDYVRSAWNSMMDESWANGMASPLQGPAQFPMRNQHRPNPNGGQLANGRAGVVPAPMPSGDSTNSSTPAVVAEPKKSCCGGEPSPTEPEATAPTPAPTGASPTPQTPSDTASGTSEEQTLSASDFFFVTYPFGDSCMGDTASCPCGDDCQCLGCVVHGNNVEGANESQGV